MFKGNIVLLYHEDIIAEYDEVLHREKFKINDSTIQLLLDAVVKYALDALERISKLMWAIYPISGGVNKNFA